MIFKFVFVYKILFPAFQRAVVSQSFTRVDLMVFLALISKDLFTLIALELGTIELIHGKSGYFSRLVRVVAGWTHLALLEPLFNALLASNSFTCATLLQGGVYNIGAYRAFERFVEGSDCLVLQQLPQLIFVILVIHSLDDPVQTLGTHFQTSAFVKVLLFKLNDMV